MIRRKPLERRKRRALSTMVGAIFMVIVIAAALNVTVWSLQQQDIVTQALIEKAGTNLGKQNEGLSISDIRVSNNKLNLTLSSSAGTASNLTAMYVVNETSQQQYRYDLNIAVDGRNPIRNIGQSNPSIVIEDDTRYSVRVISESGNSVAAKIRPVSEVAFPMSLYVIPSTVTTLENVTLLFSVMNNLTDGDVLASAVTPTLTKTLSCTAGDECQFTDYISPTSAIIPQGGSTLFKWIFKVKAPEGTTMTFNASLTNAKEGNYVIETGRVEIVQEALISSEMIVGNTLLQKPEVYLIAPGPFGEKAAAGTYRGYWGVVMVNPVDIDMKVKMVAINIYSSQLSASHKVLAAACNIVGVKPNVAAEWTCPHDGILRWQNLDSPITIKPYSAYTFLAKVEPGTIPEHEPAFMISVSVFTDFGQFSRQGYASNMWNGPPAPIPNVYMTDTSDPNLANTDSHVLGNKTLTGGTTSQRLYVAVTDFENDGGAASRILSGATLIINVPRGFTNVNIPGLNGYPGSFPSGFNSINTNTTTYSDGTIQIRTNTNEAIGDTANEAKIFYFDVDVPLSTTTKAYAMHSFISGKVNTSPAFPADAFGTFVLIVCPSSGCT